MRNLRERRHTEQVQRLNHLDQKGTVGGVWFPNARRVVTQPPGVEQAAKGSIVCAGGMWEIHGVVSAHEIQSCQQT